MHGFAAILLLLGFCAVLPLALRSVVNDLMQRIGQHGPVSHNLRTGHSRPELKQ
ncbi:MAG: hypothetical protein ACLPWG_04545 [Steroidobacteraceae bacterium]